MRTFLLACIFSMCYFLGYSQALERNIHKMIDSVITSDQQDSYLESIFLNHKGDTSYLGTAMSVLLLYLHRNDTLDEQILGTLAAIAYEHEDKNLEIGQKAVNNYIQILNDTVVKSYIRHNASNRIKYFDFNLFNTESKNELIKNIQNRKKCLSQVILQVGALNIKDARQLLQTNDNNGKDNKVAAELALCRMGDKVALQKYFSKLNRGIVTRDLFYLHIKEIEYIKHPESINFLNKVLYSDELNIMPKETMKPTKIAATAVRYLARIVVDFPIKEDFYDSDEEISIADAKKWMNKNRDKYKINSNVY